jgi:hypothetical protein
MEQRPRSREERRQDIIVVHIRGQYDKTELARLQE